MEPQDRDLFFGLLARTGFDRRPDAVVERPSASIRQPFISGVPDEGVPEAERAIRLPPNERLES
jgi:hypothetical protein